MRIFKSHPLIRLANGYLVDSPQPSNISNLGDFGPLLGFCLVIQIVIGITLAMHYNPSVLEAFNSVEHIMRDVNNGWLIRYLHSNTASAFFFLVCLYIVLYYGSYRAPRTLMWTIGTVIFILMMATAFLSYVLPYGQMSLWEGFSVFARNVFTTSIFFNILIVYYVIRDLMVFSIFNTFLQKVLIQSVIWINCLIIIYYGDIYTLIGLNFFLLSILSLYYLIIIDRYIINKRPTLHLCLSVLSLILLAITFTLLVNFLHDFYFTLISDISSYFTDFLLKMLNSNNNASSSNNNSSSSNNNGNNDGSNNNGNNNGGNNNGSPNSNNNGPRRRRTATIGSRGGMSLAERAVRQRESARNSRTRAAQRNMARLAAENQARLAEENRLATESRTAEVNQQNRMATCRHDNLGFFNPTTQEDVNNTFCDMQERDSHRAFESVRDFSRQCNDCFAIICSWCYTDVDPHSSDSDRSQ